MKGEQMDSEQDVKKIVDAWGLRAVLFALANITRDLAMAENELLFNEVADEIDDGRLKLPDWY
jgi:hypothetical protein